MQIGGIATRTQKNCSHYQSLFWNGPMNFGFSYRNHSQCQQLSAFTPTNSQQKLCFWCSNVALLRGFLKRKSSVVIIANRRGEVMWRSSCRQLQFGCCAPPNEHQTEHQNGVGCSVVRTPHHASVHMRKILSRVWLKTEQGFNGLFQCAVSSKHSYLHLIHGVCTVVVVLEPSSSCTRHPNTIFIVDNFTRWLPLQRSTTTRFAWPSCRAFSLHKLWAQRSHWSSRSGE